MVSGRTQVVVSEATAHTGSAVASGVHTPAPTKPLASRVNLGKSSHSSVSSFSSESGY